MTSHDRKIKIEVLLALGVFFLLIFLYILNLK